MKKCKKCGAPLEGFLYKTIGKLMGIKPSDNDPEICNKCAEDNSVDTSGVEPETESNLEVDKQPETESNQSTDNVDDSSLEVESTKTEEEKKEDQQY